MLADAVARVDAVSDAQGCVQTTAQVRGHIVGFAQNTQDLYVVLLLELEHAPSPVFEAPFIGDRSYASSTGDSRYRVSVRTSGVGIQ